MLHPRMNIPPTLSSLLAVTRIYRRPPKFAILHLGFSNDYFEYFNKEICVCDPFCLIEFLI